MKKFRIVGLLLVLCLITSSFVGVTFAKYTSTGSGTDTAIVAKWSIEVEGTEIAVAGETTVAFDLFSTVKDTAGAAENDVKVGDSTNIIAPGTSGSFQIDIANKSEVNAEYTIQLTETNTGNIPLQYSVDGTNWKDSIGELVMTDLTDQAIAMGGNATKTVHWRWGFEGGHDGQTDVTDTALGYANTATVTIKATIIATQVD